MYSKFEYRNPKRETNSNIHNRISGLKDLWFKHCFEFRYSDLLDLVMAWRLHEHVLRVKIDNRTRGRVKGEVWLAGVDQSLVLELTGDCGPDLAGCELSFENPNPIPMTTKPPASRQRGPAGDITAARKVRVFDVPLEDALAMCKRGETPPEHMANSLYLEWFSELNG
ncbi:MAG: hypothetical protein WBX14_12165, partial [Candidatus Udaeobacter sp.]